MALRLASRLMENLNMLHAKVLPVNPVKHKEKQVVSESRLH